MVPFKTLFGRVGNLRLQGRTRDLMPGLDITAATPESNPGRKKDLAGRGPKKTSVRDAQQQKALVEVKGLTGSDRSLSSTITELEQQNPSCLYRGTATL